MTNKSEALLKVAKIITENNLTQTEVLQIFESKQVDFLKQKHLISQVLMYIGGLVLFFGIVFFVQMNLEVFNTFNRIIITLGLGFSTYIAALFLEKENKSKILIQVFHLISIGLLPTGLFVTAYELNFLEPYGLISSTLIFTLLSAHYLLANLYKPKILFQFILIAYLNYLCLNLFALVQAYSYIDFTYFKINEILTITLGISNLLVGYHYRNHFSKFTSKFYNFIGAMLCLIGFFTLMNTSPFTTFFEVLYPFVLGTGLWLSLILNRKSILVPTIGFFVGYLIYITEEHFANTLGWPLSLILIGMILISGALAYIKVKDKVAPESLK